jgi:hypothetical protein
MTYFIGSIVFYLSIAVNDDDDVYFKKITTRVSQNLILHKMQISKRHERVNIQIIQDTDVTKQPNNNKENNPPMKYK